MMWYTSYSSAQKLSQVLKVVLQLDNHRFVQIEVKKTRKKVKSLGLKVQLAKPNEKIH